MQTYLAFAIVAACAVPAAFLLLNEWRFWALATSDGFCSALVMVGAAGAGLWASDATTAPIALALFIPTAQIIYARGLRLVMTGLRGTYPTLTPGHGLVANSADTPSPGRMFRYLFLLPGITLPPLAVSLVERLT